MRTGFLGAAALVSMVAAACGPAETEKSIRDALNQADLRRAEVTVDENVRVVRLTGSVDTLAERRRAEKIAAALLGPSGTVVNELDVEGLYSSAAGETE